MVSIGAGSGPVPTFFQMGALAFSWVTACWMASWQSCRCGEEIAMTMLASPTFTHLR